MKKNIKRSVPSGFIQVDNVEDKYGNPYTDNRKKEAVVDKGKFQGYIYKVSGSHESPFSSSVNPPHLYESVSVSRGSAIKRLKEFGDDTKYVRNDDNVFYSYYFKEKNRKYLNEYSIEVSTSHNNVNVKLLKLWKMYWDEFECDWKHSKQGLVIPIKDGKKFIKELSEVLNEE